jgi:hypothetical protein
MGELNFHIKKRGSISVVVWKDGGCRPAESAEVAMWSRIKELEEALKGILDARWAVTADWSPETWEKASEIAERALAGEEAKDE